MIGAAVGEPWLSVVGIGDDGLASLSPAARAVVEAGEVLVGGRRQLALVAHDGAERLAWRRPLEATFDDLEALRGRKVVVLASGDPMCFGVGESLARRFAPQEMRILPAPSAFSLVCARLGWSLSEIECLSVHGRPPHTLRRYMTPGARLIALSHDGSTPNLIATMLCEQGYGPSRIWAFEHLGGSAEHWVEGTAEAWPEATFAALNTVAIACVPGAGATLWPCVPGLPDEAFESDGMLTKRDVRAATLARLAPMAGQCLWDVGAGSGAVAIEWLRALRRGRAVAIERDPERCARIERNAQRLGTPELVVAHGSAPAVLDGLPSPDAIFVGGGLSEPSLVERCWQALPPGGRLVANAVTVAGEQTLLAWRAEVGGELVRLMVARAEPVGRFDGWRAAMPVTQLAVTKP
jgi:precorrin-6B C5,15-methyltransferase / cobalt-precorrin-6B C5,C15-methyltransferase